MNKKYRHHIQYYETDRMGITHHSNYIRWMEEARIYFLAELGWGFEKLEELGIISPVVAVECRYKQTTTFPEYIDIYVCVKEFKGVRMKLQYTMKNAEGKTVCEAGSEHCFLNREGRPLRLHKEFPEFYKILETLTKTANSEPPREQDDRS